MKRCIQVEFPTNGGEQPMFLEIVLRPNHTAATPKIVSDGWAAPRGFLPQEMTPTPPREQQAV